MVILRLPNVHKCKKSTISLNFASFFQSIASISKSCWIFLSLNPTFLRTANNEVKYMGQLDEVPQLFHYFLLICVELIAVWKHNIQFLMDK